MAKKMGEALAERVEREILDSRARPGTYLGGESELIDRYGCSRAVFREAVRLLERHGIVEMRRGVGGGLYIREPDSEPVANAMAIYLDFNGVRPEQLEEARLAIETACVEQLARTISDNGIERIRTLLDAEAASVQGGELHVMHDFHLLVADLTGNPAMRLFVAALTNLTRRQRTVESRNREYLDQVHLAHTKIAEAIIGHDPSVARHRMIVHLAAVSGAWLPRSDDSALTGVGSVAAGTARTDGSTRGD